MSQRSVSRPSAEERFWPKVKKAGPDECWEWLASKGKGYGHFTLESGRSIQAHRFSYGLVNGPVPEGLVLDHLCRNRGCVNPAHLEPVTIGENVLRGVGASAQNARKTHCYRGHEFTEENTQYRSGPRPGRACRTCAREQERERRAALAADASREVTGNESWHGTRGGYNNKLCRCEACTKANTEYQAAYAEKRRRAAALDSLGGQEQ